MPRVECGGPMLPKACANIGGLGFLLSVHFYLRCGRCGRNDQQGQAIMGTMRAGTTALAAFLPTALPVSSHLNIYVKPYDPYPWCTVYAGRDFDGKNCGFLTIEQCQATVSGVGGFCEPNQFYNPLRSPPRHHRR
jgi:hypothetical protein